MLIWGWFVTCKCFCEAQTNSDLKNSHTETPHMNAPTILLFRFTCFHSVGQKLHRLHRLFDHRQNENKSQKQKAGTVPPLNFLISLILLFLSASLSKSHVFQLNIPSHTLSLSLPCLQSRFRALRFSPAQNLSPFSSKRLTTAPLSSRATTAQALSPAIVLRSTHAIPVSQNVESKGQLEKQTRETIRGLPVWNSPFLYELRRERALEQRTDNQTQTLSFSVLAQEGR